MTTAAWADDDERRATGAPGAVTFDEPEQTPTIGALLEALAAAQDEMGNAAADSFNPHYKSNYADLASVRDASRPLFKHKLALTQQLLSRGSAYGVRTLLGHASGEWMATRAWMTPAQGGPQAAGAVITYLRRFMWAAALGIAQEDDDANGAEGQKPQNGNGQKPKSEPPAPAGPWRAKDDDGTPIMEAEIVEFDDAIKKLGWKSGYVAMFLDQRFGVKQPGALTRFQYRVAAKLLTANGMGKEAYAKVLKSAIEDGVVRP